MSNPKSIYNEFIRANLPFGITYDEVRAQYVTFNGKRFPTYLQAKWYVDYIDKLGVGALDALYNSLFGNDEQGVWYDPSDLDTLFQDTAGTTPVTTAGQTVGLMLDKSGNDLDATQATAAARPTYGYHPEGGIRNLLTRTEEFDNAVWQKVTLEVGVNASTSPDGSTTAESLTLTADTVGSPAQAIQSTTQAVSALETFSVYAKRVSADFIAVRHTAVSGNPYAWFNLLTGTIGLVQAGITATIADVGDGWFKCSVTGTTAASIAVNRVDLTVSNNNGNFVASLGQSVLIWGAQLEEGSTATAYQRVGSQYDVTEAGVPSVHYLAFDGVDDFMVTPTITPGIDKVQVFAGVRKLSDATAPVAEFSPSISSNDGAFVIFSAPAGSEGYQFRSDGTSSAIANQLSGYPSPVASVLTGLGDISGDLANLRIDGTQAAQTTTDQGTGNYLAYPMYIGARAGTSLPFNGNIYSLVTRFGANLETATIETTETYVAGKTGVTL